MGSLFSFLFKSLLYVLLFQLVAGSDRIVPLEKLSVGQTLVSAGQIFELGFFSPTNSGRQYIGVWYKNIPKQKVVWVANRQNPLPLTDNMASLMIGSDGNLRILDGKQNTIWTTNISKLTNDTFGLLSDSGEFVMRNNASGIDLWKSFDYPCDTFLVDMAVGINTRTGERRFLSSWTSEDDPSPGNFLVGISLALPVQAFVWNKSTIHWRSGPWNGQSFVGIPDMATSTIDNFAVETINQEGTFYVTYNEYDQSFVMVLGISPVGSLDMVSWNAEKQNWEVSWTSQENHCDVYGTCGPSGLCDATKSPICECLQGFVPRSYADWKRGSWSSGCVRRTELECQKNASHNLAPRTGKNDGFKKFSGLKIPDNYELLYDNEDAQGCEKWCLDNCSCIAYAFVTGIGCLAWSGELTDMQRFQLTGEDLFVRLAFSELDHANGGRKILIISLTTTATFIIMFFAIYIMCMRRAQQRDWFLLLRKGKLQERFAADSIETSKEMPPEIVWELPSLDFEKILDATHCFDQRNKLGEGGFGAVFWGKLQDGQEIAVKRLSTLSRQGVEEFKNEILLISKLQHRNLVRILGCCIKGEEKLIVYEWMPNKSLDTFLFDHPWCGQGAIVSPSRFPIEDHP